MRRRNVKIYIYKKKKKPTPCRYSIIQHQFSITKNHLNENTTTTKKFFPKNFPTKMTSICIGVSEYKQEK